MIRSLLLVPFVVVSLASPGVAATVNFVGSFDVDYLGADPGLVVNVDPDFGSLDFLLDPLVPTTFALFDIWTNECCVNPDDYAASPIEVAFSFTEPPPPFDGTVEGTTQGGSALFGIIQWGSVAWDGPIQFVFGEQKDGLLEVVLSNEAFNAGLFGLGTWGATVSATFTMLREPTTVVASAPPIRTPIPPAILLFGTAIAASGFGTRWKGRRTPKA